MNQLFKLFFLALMPWSMIHTRNPHRPHNQSIPSITVKASNQDIAESWYSIKTKEKVRRKKQYSLTNQFLRIKPLIQGFDATIFEEHFIPSNQQIYFRNGQGAINSDTLQELAQQVVEEIKVGQESFTHFTILKSKDFNFKTLSGLLVLKYKDYPFVLKVSIEHPHTMVKPYSKSFEASCIFIVGGNLRHLSNFTRITNLQNLQNILKFNPYYLEKIDLPRKWYWKPDNCYDLDITWKKTPYRDEQQIIIPSVYAIISDFVDIDESHSQADLNKMAMRIAMDTQFIIDPHAGNVVIDNVSQKYTMIDTENFQIMTGIDHTMQAKTYVQWYAELASGYLKKYCALTKRERIQRSFFL